MHRHRLIMIALLFPVQAAAQAWKAEEYDPVEVQAGTATREEYLAPDHNPAQTATEPYNPADAESKPYDPESMFKLEEYDPVAERAKAADEEALKELQTEGAPPAPAQP